MEKGTKTKLMSAILGLIVIEREASKQAKSLQKEHNWDEAHLKEMFEKPEVQYFVSLNVAFGMHKAYKAMAEALSLTSDTEQPDHELIDCNECDAKERYPDLVKTAHMQGRAELLAQKDSTEQEQEETFVAGRVGSPSFLIN